MGKRSDKNRSHRFRRYFGFIILIPLLLFIGFVTLVGHEAFGPLPSFEELENPKSNLATEVISSDNVMLGKYYYQNRSNSHFSELSPQLVNTLIATEDFRFFEHSGIDARRLFTIIFYNLTGRKQGGSTISQQLAKNLFPREHGSKIHLIITKIKEWITAVRLERNYTKEEIVAMYLNTVDFGANAYGIKSAARTFFNKAPSELNYNESATLIGLLKGPTLFSPLMNPENSRKRRNVSLSQLEKYKFINKVQFDSLKVQPIRLHYQAENQNYGLATYFREELRNDMKAWCQDHKKADGSSYNLYCDGLRIYTTIDSRMQRYAEEAVREHLTEYQKLFYAHWKGREPWGKITDILRQGMVRSDRYIMMKADGKTKKEIEKSFNTKVHMTVFSWRGDIDTLMSPMDSIKYYKKILQTGFMSMEPNTGYVRAWVGGLDERYFQYDHVKEGRRQVGSTFKSFLYTLAMQEGYSPCYKIPNVRVYFKLPSGQTWSPENAEPVYGGMMSLKQGLAESVNCLSAYLMKIFGPEAIVAIARKMGITSPIDPVPSLCLGTPDVSVYEMVGAYSTFANKGMWTEPIYITRIEDKNGNVLQEFVPKKVQAISEETAYLMLDLLKGVVQFGTGMRLRGKQFGLTNPIAGKTGTTQNQSDGWFMGITPDLVSGVWVGCEDRSVHFRSIELGQGAHMAMPIWGLFMKKVYADKTLHYSQGDFEKPPGKISVELDCSKYTQPGEDNINSGKDF